MRINRPGTGITTRLLSIACRAGVFGLVFLTAGCSSYAIRGRVIGGSAALVEVVDADDPRLAGEDYSGGGAVIEGVFEPDTPTAMHPLGKVTADARGNFALPVDETGAGFMLYKARLVARREGRSGAMGTIDLPRSGQRVLITLPAGSDKLQVPESYLDQALRDAKPYLEENR